MTIRVFGTGCAPCKTTLKNVQRAVTELGLGAEIEYVSRVQAMLDAGITGIPALVVDGELECVGQALDVPALETLLASCRTEISK